MAYQFHACDFTTGRIRETVELVDVQAERRLDGAGKLSASLVLAGVDLPVAAAWIAAVEPERSTICVARDGVALGEWVVTHHPSPSIASDVLELEGTHIRGFLDQVIPDMPFGGYPPQDQMLIAKDVVGQIRDGHTPTSAPAGSRGLVITIPDPPVSGVTKTRYADWTDGKFYTAGKLIDDLASAVDGFDWDIDVTLDGDHVVRTFRWGVPALGRVLSSELWHPGPGRTGGNIVDFTLPRDGSLLATQTIAVGSGSGTLRAVARANNPALVDAYPLNQKAVSYSDVNVLDALQDRADAEAARARSSQGPPKLTLDADADPVLGSYAPGDVLTVDVAPVLTQPLGWRGQVRISSYTIQPPESGPELVPIEVTIL